MLKSLQIQMLRWKCALYKKSLHNLYKILVYNVCNYVSMYL